MSISDKLNRTAMGLKPSGIRRFFDLAYTMENVVSLGIGEPEKDMIFCFCENKNIDLIYEKLGRLSDGKANGPIAMTIPVSAVGGNLTLQILLGKTKELI